MLGVLDEGPLHRSEAIDTTCNKQYMVFQLDMVDVVV